MKPAIGKYHFAWISTMIYYRTINIISRTVIPYIFEKQNYFQTAGIVTNTLMIHVFDFFLQIVKFFQT